jgi:hypothetical protein
MSCRHPENAALALIVLLISAATSWRSARCCLGLIAQQAAPGRAQRGLGFGT